MIVLDSDAVATLCRSHHVRKLSVFGSAVRGELRPSSDVDFLVEYDPSHRPRLVELQEIEDRLSELCGGRPVDLVNAEYLHRRLRDRVLSEARVTYTEG
jgi:hypothetical protein